MLRICKTVAAAMAVFCLVSCAEKSDVENAAQDIADDLALASWAGGACSAVFRADRDAIVKWSQVMIRLMNNDLAKTRLVVSKATKVMPKVGEAAFVTLGWPAFCATMTERYGASGSRRAGLLVSAP